jgi:hypothetical protein
MTRSRVYDREVTVYVWRFKNLTHFGHAAVKITGVRTRQRDDAKAYISWWPKGGASIFGAGITQGASPTENYKRDMYNETSKRAQRKLQSGAWQMRANQRIVMQDAEHGNVNVYGTEADCVVKLPALGATGVTYGLDGARMYEWWNVFRHCPHPHYKLASKHRNCAGVAALALLAGGADAFVEPPAPGMFMDPNQIERWALLLRARLNILNQVAVEVGEEVNVPEVQGGVLDVMTYAEWKELSNRDMGGATARSANVRKLDALLKEYHTYTWRDDQARKKMKVLAAMLDVIHEYLAHKLTSKRGAAVLTLGQQVLSVLKQSFRHKRGKIERPEKFEWVLK